MVADVIIKVQMIFFFVCVYVDFLSHRGGELKICCARTAAIDPVR